MKTFPGPRPFTPALLAAMAWPGLAPAQDAGPARKPAGASIEAINANYRGELQKLERLRLAQLGELAAGQPKAEAEVTHRDYFQLAIAKGLYAEAEPVALRLLRAGDGPAGLRTLASLVKIVAEADRGAFDDSLKSLAEAVAAKGRPANPPGPPGADLGLSVESKASLVEAYYQRLIRGGRYDVALKAMKVVAANVEAPAVRDLAARRAGQLERVGLAAPPIVGVDLDGKPFRLEEARGEVVLVVFWATWCLPAAQEIPWLEEAYRAHRDRGFRVVGIDVDSAQDGNPDPGPVVANVRRFLVEFNVPWPTLINGQGDQDWTRAYSIAEIPANVLIGRDGKVIHLDLAGPRLSEAVGEAIAKKP